MVSHYLTKNSMWWIPKAMFGALAPFTAVVIQPTNVKLMGTAEKRYRIGHNIRTCVQTCMSLLGFAVAVAAVRRVGV